MESPSGVLCHCQLTMSIVCMQLGLPALKNYSAGLLFILQNKNTLMLRSFIFVPPSVHNLWNAYLNNLTLADRSVLYMIVKA